MDSDKLKYFVKLSTIQVKANGSVSPSLSLEMIEYIRLLEHNTLSLTPLPLLGTLDPKYKQRRMMMTDQEMKREDIDKKSLYIVKYDGIYLIGRFTMQWFGWIFVPNLGSMNPQVNDLEAIYKINNLDDDHQKTDDSSSSSSTTSFIMGYL